MERPFLHTILLLPTLLALAGCGSNPPELTDADRILAAETGIDLHILREIKEMGTLPVRMEGIDVDYEAVQVNGITFEVHQDNARRVIRDLRRKFADSGALVFLQEVHFGYEPDRIGILRSTDKYDILRVRRTNGINYDLSDEDVINRIREWDALYQLDFVGADFDWFEATFGTRPKTTRPLPARSMPFARISSTRASARWRNWQRRSSGPTASTSGGTDQDAPGRDGPVYRELVEWPGRPSG